MGYAILWFVALAGAFFFLIVRPQRRQVAAHRALIASLAVGEEIVTSGGMLGTIAAIEDETVDVQVAPGVVVKVARGAIAQRVPAPAPEPGVDDGETT
jgi:preprotein translocase subunit YajC